VRWNWTSRLFQQQTSICRKIIWKVRCFTLGRPLRSDAKACWKVASYSEMLTSFNLLEWFRTIGRKGPLYAKVCRFTAWSSILVKSQRTICRCSRWNRGVSTFNSTPRWFLSRLRHSILQQLDRVSSRSFPVTCTILRSSFLRFGKPPNWKGGFKDTKLSWMLCRQEMLSLFKSWNGNM